MHSASINCARWRFVKRKRRPVPPRTCADRARFPGKWKSFALQTGGYAVRCFSGQRSAVICRLWTFYSVPLPKCSRQQDQDHHDRYGKRRSGELLEMRKRGVHVGQDKASAWSTECRWLPQYRSGIYAGRLRTNPVRIA